MLLMAQLQPGLFPEGGRYKSASKNSQRRRGDLFAAFC
jgi:hypothetical protein